MPQQSAIDRIINRGVNAANSVAKAASKANYPDSARAASKLARSLLDTKQNISKIDKQVSDLEKSAPGTTKAIKEVSATMKEIADFVPLSNVPNGLRPMAKDVAAATKSFDNFAVAYDKYQKAPASSLFSPSTWGVKTKAGVAAVGAWKQFKADYDKLQQHVPAPLKDPKLQKGVQDAAKAGLDILDSLLK